jgi:hypothetical protein
VHGRDEAVPVARVGHQDEARLRAQLAGAGRERRDQTRADLLGAFRRRPRGNDDRVEAAEFAVERNRLVAGLDDLEQRLPAAQRSGEPDGLHRRVGHQ